MPFETGNFVSNLTGVKEEKTFCNRPENLKASKDLKFLASRTNLTALEVLGKIRFTSAGKPIGDFLPVPVDMSSGLVKFPMNEIDVNNQSQYVAVVLYNGEQAEDVLLFNATIWSQSHGLFSPFKTFAKTGEYGVKLNNKEKLSEYKFGNVLKDYLN
ncbi:MAG: hypothetical protein ACI4T8_01440 [Christensenellales bacterium]